jgi:hypothetical protein
LTLAAASSIANGNRSSFKHKPAIASSSFSAGTKPGFRCAARSTNNPCAGLGSQWLDRYNELTRHAQDLLLAAGYK